MALDRREVCTLGLAGLLSTSAIGMVRAAGPETPTLAEGGMSHRTAYVFGFDAIEGGRLNLADHAGHPIMIVNTASLCSFTPQYAGLQEIFTRFKGDGFALIGVPSNDFGQEHSDPKAIDETVHHQYGVTFPIAATTAILGPSAHPFYKWAATERPRDVPRWNFHKYLIGTDGKIADVFASEVEPTDTRIVTAIARQVSRITQQRPG